MVSLGYIRTLLWDRPPGLSLHQPSPLFGQGTPKTYRLCARMYVPVGRTRSSNGVLKQAVKNTSNASLLSGDRAFDERVNPHCDSRSGHVSQRQASGTVRRLVAQIRGG